MFVIAGLTVLQHSETSRHNTTTATWMVSPYHIISYTQHMNTQFGTNNFINILYLNIDIKPLHFIFVNCFDIVCNISFKEHLPVAGYSR